MKSGFAYGLSQITQFVAFSAMFYVAGLIIEDSMDEQTGIPEINPEDVFLALFAIMMGAMHSGTAASFGPDMGKALAAATRIFKIMETPSKIDAVQLDQDSSKKRLNVKEVEGKIEFKDVWFRYPTRKEDFVLRGLNITINPQEIVGLVGESGCGKSTFVNLMMRFYDVDAGEILLDGTNIKDFNLHDLRKAISLVMQEPIVFNYSILENILYGKLDATNTEVREACEIANALEFIEAGVHSEAIDDSATGLIKMMKQHKEEVEALIGEEKYKEEMTVLEKLEKQEENKGDFQAIDGNVDKRADNLKDIKLKKGFDN